MGEEQHLLIGIADPADSQVRSGNVQLQYHMLLH